MDWERGGSGNYVLAVLYQDEGENHCVFGLQLLKGRAMVVR